MSLKLSSNNIEPYNYYSSETSLNPIITQLTLDYNTPNTYSNVLVVYLIATENIYTNISLEFSTEDLGIDWFMSYDNNNWFKSIILIDLDARSGNIIIPLFFKSGMLNDGSVIDGNYTQCKININYDEIYK